MRNHQSNKQQAFKARARVLALLLTTASLTACAISIPRRDSLPVTGSHADRLLAADQYCLKVGEKLDRRGYLRGLRTVSTAALAAAGLVTAISGAYFVDEASEDSPSADKLETRGTIALTSALVTAIGGVVYGWSKDEYDARRDASREINKAHALAESTKVALVEKKDPSEYTQAEKDLPAQLMDSCYAIADKNEERGQKAVESMITEAGARAAEVLKKRNDVREKCAQGKSPGQCKDALDELLNLDVRVQGGGGGQLMLEVAPNVTSPPTTAPPTTPPRS
jgi:hypothetical protein